MEKIKKRLHFIKIATQPEVNRRGWKRRSGRGSATWGPGGDLTRHTGIGSELRVEKTPIILQTVREQTHVLPLGCDNNNNN